MFLPGQKTHPCRVCSSPTKFGDRFCKSCGPDPEWERASFIFYEAAVESGFCKVCGESAQEDREIEEPFSLGDYIEHLPGCYFGRSLKASDIVGD